METFVGKFLVRKSTNTAGQTVLVLTGGAIPDNFKLSEVSDQDEIWVARLGLVEVNKYVPKNKGSTGFNGSPEDFLARNPAHTGEFSEWTKKV